jgi:hypothetical protein
MLKKRRKLLLVNASLFEVFLLVSFSFAIAFFMQESFASAELFPADALKLDLFGGNPLSTPPSTVTPAQAFNPRLDLLGGAESVVPSTLSEGGKYVFKPMGYDLGLGGLGGGVNHLIAGLAWGAVAYGAAKFIGPLFGLDDRNTNALAIASFAGVMTYQGLGALGPTGWGATGKFAAGFAESSFGKFLVGHPGLIAIGVTVAVFLLMYKKTSTQTVNFQCLPYEPPLGYAKCEECNKDPMRPCSEYRCKALGQACELVNKEFPGKELCARVTKFDVSSPTITPWADALKPNGLGLKYVPDSSIRPPAVGVKIVSNADGGCLPAFTQLQFGILTNEPAQCKIDYNHTKKFDDMQFYFGEENYYAYNHTQVMRLPAPESNQSLSGSPILKNDGSFSLYVRCRDPVGKEFGESQSSIGGNENVDEYAISFCVSKAPDTTPPIIEGTSILQNSPVRYNADAVPIEVYTNEPADCKWSRLDKAYTDMENAMTCSSDPGQINADLLYTCSGNLAGIKNMEANTFYFRCRDQPLADDADRNTMSQSYKLDLRGSRDLNVKSIIPNGTIFGSTTTIPVNIEVETMQGSDEGKSICYFSTEKDNLDSYIKMFETNDVVHTQDLQLTSGSYEYFVRCVDAGGNTAVNSTKFEVKVDKAAPSVTRVYKELDALKIVTDEDAECSYSIQNCAFNFADGLKMIYNPITSKNMLFAPWKTSLTLYVKCKDNYGNEPSSAECSIVASPVEVSGSS